MPQPLNAPTDPRVVSSHPNTDSDCSEHAQCASVSASGPQTCDSCPAIQRCTDGVQSPEQVVGGAAAHGHGRLRGARHACARAHSVFHTPFVPQVALLHQRHWDGCTFPATTAYRSPSLHLASLRVLKAELSQTPVGRTTVTFPPSLLNASLSALHGSTVDVSLKVVARSGPMVTDAVTVALSDPATGLEVPVRSLQDPVTVTFPRPRPWGELPQEEYQCVSDAGGTWETEGVSLTVDAATLHCHTTRLSTVTVLPVVHVHRVQVLLLARPCGSGSAGALDRWGGLSCDCVSWRPSGQRAYVFVDA